MAKNYYLPKDAAGRSALFTRFAESIPAYSAALGLSAADLAAQAADSAYFDWLATQCLGDGDAPATPQAPAPPASAPPAAVPTGIVPRFTVYLANDEKAGQWSAVVSVNVG